MTKQSMKLKIGRKPGQQDKWENKYLQECDSGTINMYLIKELK